MTMTDAIQNLRVIHQLFGLAVNCEDENRSGMTAFLQGHANEAMSTVEAFYEEKKDAIDCTCDVGQPC